MKLFTLNVSREHVTVRDGRKVYLPIPPRAYSSEFQSDPRTTDLYLFRSGISSVVKKPHLLSTSRYGEAGLLDHVGNDDTCRDRRV